MNEEFSIKRPGVLLWKCGVSYDKIRQMLLRREITDDWLVCPFGRSDLAVPISRIDELRGDQPQTERPEKQNFDHNSRLPTFIIFNCLICRSRIRITTSAAGRDVQNFRCSKCNQRYSLSIPESDGIAYLILPEQSDAPNSPHSPNYPPHIVSAISVFDLPADCLWSDIRQRYRKLIGQYHPDKVQHLGDELQKLAAQKTKEYVSAFELLQQFFSKS